MSLSSRFVKLALAVAFFTTVAGMYFWLSRTGGVGDSFTATNLRGWINELGPWGPIGVVGLMIVAILASPLPSAPIALGRHGM